MKLLSRCDRKFTFHISLEATKPNTIGYVWQFIDKNDVFDVDYKVYGKIH